MADEMPLANAAQFEYWNDQTGRTWAELQGLLDRQLAPLGARAMQALGVPYGARVLDIGCGCGGTSLSLAAYVGPAGAVVGVDLSAPMLAVARARAASSPHVTFLQADAQVAAFNAPFDAALSRFGVMFFADPVAAFRNLRAALRPGARLAFVCWRAPSENVWMMAPLGAALRHVPAPPPDDPDAPGPFAFARADRVRAILADAGFTRARIEACDMAIGGFDLETALRLALRVGPLSRLLREAGSQPDGIIESVKETLRGYLTPGGVLMPSASWIVTAEA
jgi:SAM-dependent methyltransferase